MIKIIIKLYGKPFVTLQNEIVSSYLLHAKPENQREALEYASFGRELDNMKKLVEREKIRLQKLIENVLKYMILRTNILKLLSSMIRMILAMN